MKADSASAEPAKFYVSKISERLKVSIARRRAILKPAV